MVSILLAAILVLLAGISAVSWVMVRNLRRTVRNFLTPQAENQASPLAQAVDAASIMIGRAITMQLKATFMGNERGQQKGEQAVMADIAEDALATKAPLIGGLLSAFPTLQKTLRRNPQLLDFALSKLGNLGSGSGHNGGGSSASPKFRL